MPEKSRRSKGGVDVFAFLERDSSRVSLASVRSVRVESPVHDDSDGESDRHNSDSGVSMTESPTEEHSQALQTRRLETLEEDSDPEPTEADEALPSELQQQPEGYYWPNYHARPPSERAASDSSSDSSPESSDSSSSGPTTEPSSGYALLASSLSTSSSASASDLPPLYRRFEALNHRILLQLQDEIAELEEDLQAMDETDARDRRNQQDGEGIPASRRLDWQWRGTEVHCRRLDLLGRIHHKVGQYSKSCLIQHNQVSTLSF